MYKKTLISILLVSSIMFSPLAQAKGVHIPVISTVVNIYTNFIESIPVVGPIIIGSYNIIENVAYGVGKIVLCSLDPIGCLTSNTPNNPASITVPSAPQKVNITNCATINPDGTCGQYINHGFEITWDAPASFGGASSVGYIIYRGTSTTSLTTSITTTEMNNGQRSFLENRIQDPTKPFYYKVVAFNSAGNGVASAVVESPMNIKYLTNPLTLVGTGFDTSKPTETQVHLTNSEDILCTGAVVKDAQTITGAVCDITAAPTGTWTVKIISPDGKYSTCDNCFKISLPEPKTPLVTISTTDLTSGVFKIDSVAGDNLYTGATVWVTANGQKLNCFSLGNFDYINNKFSGGQCNVQSFLRATNGDMSKLSVEITNDSNSIPVIPSNIPSFTCTSNSYTPAAVDTCPAGSSFDQYSNCGVKSTAIAGKTCSSSQVCQSGTCVGCTPLTQSAACSFIDSNNTQYYYCDSRKVDDNCGGKITCNASICSTVCNNVSCQ